MVIDLMAEYLVGGQYIIIIVVVVVVVIIIITIISIIPCAYCPFYIFICNKPSS